MWAVLLWFREAFVGVFRNFTINLFATSLSFLSFFILAFWIIVGINVQHTSEIVESNVQISLNLNDDVNDYEGISQRIEDLNGVESYVFINKEEAFQTMKESLGERENMLTELGFNPLPASFQIKVVDPERIELIAKEIETWGVDKSIKYGENYITKLFNATEKIRHVSMIVLIIMIVSTGAMVYVSIRMNIINRNKELEIKDLVGAGKFNIRVPFIIEGILLTTVSASALLVLTNLFYDQLIGKLLQGYPGTSFASLEIVMSSLVPVLLIIAITIGSISSLLSTQRYLKRH